MNIRLNISDIRDIKKIHIRHIVQSVIAFTCFCTLDTIEVTDNVWLISAAAAVAAIALIMIFAGKIHIGAWSNVFNVSAALFCVGCYFIQWLLPSAIFFVTLSAGIRLVYARGLCNDYSTLVFIIISVFAGIVLRFVLILLPVWCLALFMLTTVFNPVIKKNNVMEDATKIYENKIFHKPLIIIAAIVLALFFICIEVFGGPLTDEVSHNFPMNLVNLAYLAGYMLFIAAILTLRVKLTSIFIMILAIFGIFFFLIPPTTMFGIYFLLFLGGGLKVLTIAFPVTMLAGGKKYLGALLGVFIYRLAFLTSGAVKALAKSLWNITSSLTYTLAAINIVMGLGLILLLIYWDRQDLKAKISREIIVKEVIRDVPIIKKPLPSDLSVQERRVAELILKGKSQKKIADEINVSENTVKSYMARLYTKAGVNGQKELIIYFTTDN